MIRYHYTAIDSRGVSARGEAVATSSAALTTQLAARGLFVMRVRTRRQRRHRMGATDLALGLGALATFLESGLRLMKALNVFEELAPPGWQSQMPLVRDRVREGATLSVALSDAGLGLPFVSSELIRIGEAAGTLAAGVRAAATSAEEERLLRAAITAALAYPALLLVACVASSTLLLGVVVPRFAAILADVGGSLPSSTQLALRLAELTRQSWPLLLVGIGAAALFAYATRRNVGLRARVHDWLLRVPLLGALRHNVATSRVTGAAAALISAGARLPRALQLAAPAGGDEAVRERVERAVVRIQNGAPASQAIEVEHAFSPIAARMLRVGEEAGEVAALLRQASLVEGERAKQTIHRLLRLIEPTLILAFGGFIAFIAASLLQAVYSVRPGT